VLYAYDEAGHLLGEYDATGALIEETVWLGDIPVATLRPTGATVAIYYIHSDPLNTPRQVTRPSDNTPMSTWNSDPFGTDAANPNAASAGTFAYNLRFPGQVFDGQVGLHQNYFRDYDPATARYMESDPVGLSDSVNTFAYVVAHPISRWDSSGLSSLIYNPPAGTVTVVNGAGQAVGTFPAANNAQSGSRGPWPPGAYSYGYHTTHPDDDPDSPYGSHGNWVFNVPGCIGCGVHSGRANRSDRRGRSGFRFATNGCIRTTDDATRLIDQLTAAGDPLTGLLVTPSPIATNLPSLDPSLSGGPKPYLPDNKL
jgi:RHS repeat-associated protein